MADSSGVRASARAGMVAIIPLLIGGVPFGLVAGASAAEAEVSYGEMMMWSIGIFAGASQLALLDLLQDNAGWLAGALTVWIINLRLLLYSTSLAPHFDHVPLSRRLVVAYALTDQSFAVSNHDLEVGAPPERRLPFYLGAAYVMWSMWMVTCTIGFAVGDNVPDDVPLEFAVPMVFLGLLIISLRGPATFAAATVSGAVTLFMGEVGLSDIAIIVGALTGIATGVVVAERVEGAAP